MKGEKPDVAAIAASAKHGRAGLVDLFRLLGAGKDESVRHAAGHALSVLWKQDELIPEEEKALVTRGFDVKWKARRRYPRDLVQPIAMAAEFGVPFLAGAGDGVGPMHLEWSARILGSDRASLEQFSPWTPGPGSINFEVDPRDLATNGPYRRILNARVRAVGLTSAWELDLPQITFTFELDPILTPGALLASDDAARAEAFASAVRLAVRDAGDGSGTFTPMNSGWAIRGRPVIELSASLPADLAHAIALEIETVAEAMKAGGVVAVREHAATTVAITTEATLPGDAIKAPGEQRMRAVLVPDLHRGWCDPEVRSIWPGVIATPWVTVHVTRR